MELPKKVKKDLVKLEKELMKNFLDKIKPMEKKEADKILKKINHFLTEKQAGALLFSLVDKDMNVKTEYSNIKMNKKQLRTAIEKYMLEITPIKDIFEQLKEEDKVEHRSKIMVN